MSEARYPTVSVYLVTPEAEALMAFLGAVFGAEPVEPPMHHADGGLAHVALTIGDSVLMLGGPPDRASTATAMIHVYVDDCDATHAKALDAGATSIEKPADQVYGDRRAAFRDLAGNAWYVAMRGRPE